LGISGAGMTTWEKIGEKFPDLQTIRQLSVSDLVELDGFAEKSANQIVQGIVLKSDLIDELLEIGVTPEVRKVAAASGEGVLDGMTFVITGSLSRPRSEIEMDIKGAGGKVTGSVSNKTTAVITNDTESSSSKMK